MNQKLPETKPEPSPAPPVAGCTSVLLFTRIGCPRCPAAADAAGRLGIPIAEIDAGTDEGFAMAARMNVMSTPTAILLAADGAELARAADAAGIAGLAGMIE